MRNPTWLGRVAERIRRLCSALDDAIFEQSDLDANARGWEARRDRPFTRTYRDPRWDSIAACPNCQGEGTFGAHPCGECDGRGTVRTDLNASAEPTRTVRQGGVTRINHDTDTPRRQTGPRGRRPEGPAARRARPAPTWPQR